MTHNGGQPHTNVGDRGQRYVVYFRDGDGKEQLLGWTEHKDGGSLVRRLALHPVWKLSRIEDRRPE